MSVPEVGAAMTPLEQAITADLMMAYGAATWDWHRMHYDGDYVRSLGLPGPMLDGQAQGAFFARAVMDWLGPRAFIRRLSFRMRAMIFPGDTIMVEGVVREATRSGGDVVIVLDQTIKVGERLAGTAETEVTLRDGS
jgi:acyl dehydratase